MSKGIYGRTTEGKPIDDTMIEELADKAERGYEAGSCAGVPAAEGGRRLARQPNRSSRCASTQIFGKRRSNGPL